MIENECILVTGCAGFIGSHLCQALLKRGARVVGVDNFDPFYSRDRKQHNLDSILAMEESERFSFYKLDICAHDELTQTMKDAGINGVIHLAAKAGVRPSITDPVGYAQANILGTQSVLSSASAAGCKRVVCASSSSVYGNNKKTPFAESDAVEHPISPYAATKLSCELIGNTHHTLTGLPIAMLRFFTVFGPRQRPDLAMSLFLSKVSAGETINKFGDGSTSRDYTFVDDIVRGVISAYQHIDEHGFRVWNLGGDHPITLNEMIATISEVVGQDPVINQMGMQPGDVNQTWADLERSNTELEYRPTTSISDGLKKQWAWMQENQAIINS